MKPKPFLSLLLFLALSLQLSFAQVLKDTIVIDYGIINKTVIDKVQKYGANQVLVVMDIDNTILTGDTDLGSDIWYQWQRGELDVKPAPDQKLADNCLFGEAIGLLYELGTMSLTDTLLPGYIHSWQASGVTLFALTSRSPDYRTATERELGRNKINLSASELKSKDGHNLFLDYQTSNRKISYLDGIMMTSGMNKGNMLADILDSAGMSFKAIIFIDDTRKNIDAVKNKYLANNQADMVLFNYTGIMSERLKKNNGVVLTPEQAKKMDRDWDELIRTLNAIFPERMEKSECASRE
jgi:hypothetical protein